ncbi:helix-turn-helix domain-containing protein [Anaeromicrobium sp.]|jgi:AraC-like DNA-binding protein|uniref:helix-turn-helix domain-containing protein n=1 Tax=Anaeromicrobium sp. TaxID=1929132 RepID=UPI002ED609D8
MLENKVSLGKNVSVICENEECTIHQIHNKTGEGTMKFYKVFPGIYLMYNDFHMQNCHANVQYSKDMLCIDHCREGRIRWDLKNDAYLYLKAGDLRVENRKHHKGNFEFPLKHYHGITISFFIEEAAKSLLHALNGFPVNLYDLQKKFCENEVSFVIRSGTSIEHIFSELYTVPSKIKKQYFQIKILELLLYLSALDISENKEKRPYFYKTQVEKIKAIEKFMTSDLEKHYTLNELSQKFDISLTSMKTCFKGVYGSSIYAYMRACRMNQAAVLLRQSRANIVSIAGRVGYESPSKFSVAFKSIMGKSPLEYRKHFV